MFQLKELQKFEDCKALIFYKDVNSFVNYSYKELIQEANKVLELLQDLSDKQVIGIFVQEVNNWLFPLIIGILNSSHGFSCLSEWPSKNTLNRLHIKYFFYDKDDLLSDDFQIVASLNIFDNTIKLVKFSSFLRTDVSKMDVCYQICTSGSTGASKTINVPFSCINPNILGLQKIFQLTSEDVIFQVSPPTFDPFVVDFFLALLSGAALLLVDKQLRFSENMIGKLFEKNGVTFIQTTPSLFQRWSPGVIRNHVLHQNSSLRLLVLGGESFPKPSVLREWQDWPSNKRIFNIYGITEVSCWATILEVQTKDLELEDIPIGRVFDDETLLDFKAIPEGGEELLIGSETRICSIEDELPVLCPVFRSTGDQVVRLNDQIFCVGRTNSLIKKFGIRINLSKIDNIAKKLVLNTCCIFENNKIILFYISNEINQQELLKHLRNELKDFEIPDEIFKLNEFLLSAHGKVCKQKLSVTYKEMRAKIQINPEHIFLEELNYLSNLSDNPAKKPKLDLSFKAIGGSSIEALRITMSLESKLNRPLPDLLTILLNQNRSLEDAHNYLKGFTIFQVLESSKPDSQDLANLRILTKFDLEKCVDASISVIKVNDRIIVSVGSHSGILFNVLVNSLEIISKVQLPDRIESQVTLLHDKNCLVGCYDGYLYCFNILNGEIIWKFDSQGMIKSKPLVIENLTIFGNYNELHNLWCLNKDGQLLWNQRLGTKGILASPLLIENQKIFLATLDGTCSLLEFENGSIIWRKKFDSPIFASPQKIPETNEIILAEVTNKVHCLDYLGNIKWTIETGGNIFSSFEFLVKENNEILILFGCHSKKVICLLYNNENVKIDWEVELQSQIYATPKLLRTKNQDFIVCCSTNGYLNLINLETRNIEGTFKLPGEIFSSPAVFQDAAKHSKIFVGCRDNFLYCFNFEHL